MILGHIHKCWEALAKPHSNISVHIYRKRLKALLESTHGIKLEGTGICPKIHAANLGQPQRANGHKTCRIKIVDSVQGHYWGEAVELWFLLELGIPGVKMGNNHYLSSWHSKSTIGSMMLDTVLP